MRSLDLDQLFEIMNPTQLPTGFNLPRKKWSQLNRIRTDHGRCGHLLYNWGLLPTPNYDCGHDTQTISHIVKDCPIIKKI